MRYLILNKPHAQFPKDREHSFACWSDFYTWTTKEGDSYNIDIERAIERGDIVKVPNFETWSSYLDWKVKMLTPEYEEKISANYNI